MTLWKCPFKALLLGRFLGALGTQIFLLSGIYRVFKSTGSFLLTGATGLALFLPTLALVFFAGRWTDRLQKIGFWYSILQLGFCAVTLAMMVFTPSSAFVFLLLFVASALRALRSPLLYSLLKLHAADRSDVSMARWMTISWQLPLVLGPMLFSLLEDLGGPHLLAGASFSLMTMALLCSLRSARDRRPLTFNQNEKESSEELTRRAAFSKARRIWMRSSVADLLVMGLLSFTTLLPFLLSSLKQDPAHLGYLRAALSLGSLACASLLTASPLIRIKDQRLFILSLAVAAVLTGAMSVTTSFAGLLGLCFFFGVMDGISILHREALQLSACHLGNAGQTAALSQIFNSASEDIGEFRAGMMAEFMGAARCLQICAFFGLGLSLLFLSQQPREESNQSRRLA